MVIMLAMFLGTADLVCVLLCGGLATLRCCSWDEPWWNMAICKGCDNLLGRNLPQPCWGGAYCICIWLTRVMYAHTCCN